MTNPTELPDLEGLDLGAARAAGALDPSLIARMANALFAAPPAPSTPAPGAALPSASLFAVEPAYGSIPGVPPAPVPLTPNNNPGSSALPFPSGGAAPPSAPAFSGDRGPSLIQAAELRAPQGFSRPDTAASDGVVPQPAADPALHRHVDFATLPERFQAGELAFDHRLLPQSSAPAVPFSAVAPHHPVEVERPRTSTTASFPQHLDVLDLGALAIQHRADVPSVPLSGTRAFDAHIFRRDFPILDQQVNGRPLVWLDNGATTQKPRAVIDRLVHFYTHENSNIHRAAHTLAARSTDAYESAREKIRAFINAPSTRDIIFVRGTTEGINLIAQAWGRRNISEGDEIVVSHLEHHANIVPWQQIAVEKGARLRVAPVDDSGQIILEEYEKLFNPRTRIVSFTQVSNVLGTITPAKEMTEIARRHGARVVIDGAQGICHMPVDVQALGADFYVFSGHKMFAPTGIGVVYGRASELETMPPWQGGGNMIADVTFERTVFQGAPERFEAGTGNIADAIGLGAAIDYLTRIGMSNVAAYEHELLDYATQGLLTIPGLKFIAVPRERAGVLSFVLDGCKTEDVGKALDQEGIAVRAGHHCAQPILRRFGFESSVRPSLALYNTRDDIDALVAALLRIQGRRGRNF
ncbi:SufS family cysteine desulfurase [Bradyrhizobium sp. U87765 SZCCT0131]|uniref:family 2A encapsulin nanocompartment cargo protein cysteine desulfurase n=1 Tax=unclassified Bradyrhizobium TaxID=2631580 RepID=UPI001BAE0C73|nr:MULTISPECIES: family 2A encapsulin nanocompartment cargo protein cysteine desulfurase [unclassified Bradyrhizobium]MBR1222188.1 SufS family cysteine desulfurase [Bradyrhizobium sp. U87765 SZCCT0131]MBR1265683.1 SufS family cysteine desulfurase [Bradyrhizobium sp. U87765 SZCCT0134]MBR1307889.1 SufS family cysteine desulfurase [Bradyrhizobium sp. U87765 SZCCT0110]MBR1324001.1 SufS family cysteine desulfurase [Bradyrhizobium sp. U87765 SZCCT0109]MBR1348309.1 SufS family cysteine desulfurase [B